MKKAIAAGLISVGLLLGLTGCYDPVSERAKACIESGGSWVKDTWGNESCTLPGAPEPNKEEK